MCHVEFTFPNRQEEDSAALLQKPETLDMLPYTEGHADKAELTCLRVAGAAACAGLMLLELTGW